MKSLKIIQMEKKNSETIGVGLAESVPVLNVEIVKPDGSIKAVLRDVANSVQSCVITDKWRVLAGELQYRGDDGKTKLAYLDDVDFSHPLHTKLKLSFQHFPDSSVYLYMSEVVEG